MLKKYSYLISSFVIFVLLGFIYTTNVNAQSCSGNFSCGLTASGCQGNSAYPNDPGCALLSPLDCSTDTVHCEIATVCENDSLIYACSGSGSLACNDSAHCGLEHCSGPSSVSCAWVIVPTPTPAPTIPPPTAPPPTAPPPPTCTISLSPPTLPLTLGGVSGTITATVSCTAAVDQVTFTVAPSGIASVTSPGTVVTANTTYTTTVTPVSVGGTVVTGHVYSGGSERSSATAIVNVTTLSGWFQVKDADVYSGSDLITHLISGSYFNLSGTGGYPGVPTYKNSTDLSSASVSNPQHWITQSTSTNPKVYDYRTLSAQIPATTTTNTIATNSITGSTLTTGGTLDATSGYYWYKYNGTSLGDLTLTSAANIGARKVVLLIDSANFTINGPINVTDGTGFFMVLVGKTSSGTKGNIVVGSGVGGTTYDLEGIYEADSTFNDSAGSSKLTVRGSVAAYGGFSLLRDLAGGNITTPAEFFEYAPDQILLYPKILSTRRLNWKEVAP